jgi:bacterioferritin (cytochrome b1)
MAVLYRRVIEEEGAINLYKASIELAAKENNRQLADLFQHIMGEEEHHREELLKQLCPLLLGSDRG